MFRTCQNGSRTTGLDRTATISPCVCSGRTKLPSSLGRRSSSVSQVRHDLRNERDSRRYIRQVQSAFVFMLTMMRCRQEQQKPSLLHGGASGNYPLLPLHWNTRQPAAEDTQIIRVPRQKKFTCDRARLAWPMSSS